MVEHSSFSGHSPNSDYSPYNHDIRRLFSDGLNLERLRGSRILVIGATGLIGSCIVDVLMQNPDKCYQVIASGRNRNRAKQNNGIYGLKEAGCSDDDLILVHDAVRPLLSQDIISSNIAICQKYGYAITGIKCREAILESEDGFTSTTSIPRDKLIRTQTPQTFRLGNLIAAHEEAMAKGITNSVASCTLMAELGGRQMHVVPGSEKNIKITTIEDLEILKALMKVQPESWLK